MIVDTLPEISLTCINNDIHLTSKNIIEILDNNNDSSKKKCQVVKGEKEILGSDDLSPLQYSSKNLKILLWEPKSKPGTTIFASDVVDGSNSIIYILGKKYNQETFKIYITLDKEARYPTFMFSHKKGDAERAVRAALEDKWIFFQKGIPLPTEDVAVYNRKRINQRLNREVIFDILIKEGWNITNDSFWKPAGEFVSIFFNFRD